MGIFDATCGLTGIGLRDSDAVLVPLRRRHDATYLPFALPMYGKHDRAGAISFEPDRNTDLLFSYFRDLADGRITVDRHYAALGVTTESLDGIMELLERNTSVWLRFRESDPKAPPVIAVDGDPLVFVLVARTVWQAIVDAAESAMGSLDGEFDSVFGPDPIATGIYGCSLNELADRVREIAAVHRFMAAHGMAWRPHSEGFAAQGFGWQQWSDDLEHLLQSARQRFEGDPIIEAGLDAHAADIERVREEYEYEPD
ncbi:MULTISPECIES: hypothetical protein [Tsukamurella]|uniref:Uncharacterized protein n=1 Tax=Tsukamurella strandjordii TaxID=147577 RepID=A0AA90NJD5_9ACTN|nr:MULTISPECIES: hypothetical protein [Tsukamurella]MDP0399810.1 hypothetical protein [Tsukamurella strandjordii]GIZ97409.1 hypothetical protein TTY48_20210 [Tsukamurella sp. TY48]